MKFLKINQVLIIVLIGSFFASLAYSFHFQIKPLVDAKAYDKIAQNIASGVGYREEPQKDIRQDYAIARVGPLYEYFLAEIYKVFGHSYPAVWIFQALLHALSAWLLYLTCLLIFAADEKKKIIGLWAAAIFGFYPDLIEISAMLMTETLYLFFVCLLFYLFFLYVSRNSYWLATAFGFIFGLATLARPPVLFLLPVALFYFWQKNNWRQAALFFIALFIVFIPWTYRNYQAYGQIMPFGAAGNYNFWIGNWHGGDGEQSPQPFHYAFTSTHDIKEINGESMRQFKSFIINYPAEFIKLTFLRINKYFSIIRPMGFWFYQSGLGQALFIFSSVAASVFLFVFSFAGSIKAVLIKEERLNYLLAFLIFTPLIIFVTVVETRYRFQIYPLLAIFAAYYLSDFSGWRAWFKDKILYWSMGLVFLNGAIDFIFSLDKIKDRFMRF